MKNKLLITSISTLLTVNAMAYVLPNLSKEEIDKRNRALLDKAGIELPESYEISIVSVNKYLNSNNVKQNANDAHMAKIMKQYLTMNNEQKQNGYVKESEPRAKELMELKQVAPIIRKNIRMCYPLKVLI